MKVKSKVNDRSVCSLLARRLISGAKTGIAVVLIVSLSSCSEYATRFPVSHESEAVSYDHLLGDWNLYQYAGDTLVHRSNTLDSHGIRIMSFNRNEFLIEVIPENDSALSTQDYVNDIHLMRGWITDIAGKQFLNLNPITESGYLLFSLYQIQINDDTLISTTISERLFKELNVRINSVSDHAAFVASVMDQDELWNVQYRYLKME